MLRFKLLSVSLLMLASNAAAVATPPCTPAGAFAGMDIIPLSNGSATYCVSDYGWSDAWFVGTSPVAYNRRIDVLSGDDAPNLHFGIKGGEAPGAVSGFGWISPILDGGGLGALAFDRIAVGGDDSSALHRGNHHVRVPGSSPART